MSEKLVQMSHDLSELLETVGKEEGIEDAMATWQEQINGATTAMSEEFGTATSIQELHDLIIQTRMISLDRIGIDGVSGMGRYRPKVLLRDQLTQEQLTQVLSKLGITKSAIDLVPDISRLHNTEYDKPHKYGDEFVGMPTQVAGVYCGGKLDAERKLSNIELAFDPKLFMANE